MTQQQFSQLKLNDNVTYNDSLYRIAEVSDASDIGTYYIGIERISGHGPNWIELMDNLDNIENLKLTVDISA